VEEPITGDQIEPIAASPERSIQVVSSSVRIRDLTIDRVAIAAYLDAIAPDKQEIALVHALEVGITEMAARRARFR
jgi:hypothetical protein